MPGRSIAGYVDEVVAERLHETALAEGRSSASLVGQAVGLYTALPEAARASYRRIETFATEEERRWFEGELTRLLLRADMDFTARRMAAELGSALPQTHSEEELEALAVAWTEPSPE